MKDKQTETKLRLIALQLESWKKLHDLITYGLDKAKPIISVEQERQYTEVRRGGARAFERGRLETEWNSVFTKVGVAQGQLKSRRKAFAEVTPFQAFMSRLSRRPTVA